MTSLDLFEGNSLVVFYDLSVLSCMTGGIASQEEDYCRISSDLLMHSVSLIRDDDMVYSIQLV